MKVSFLGFAIFIAAICGIIMSLLKVLKILFIIAAVILVVYMVFSIARAISRAKNGEMQYGGKNYSEKGSEIFLPDRKRDLNDDDEALEEFIVLDRIMKEEQNGVDLKTDEFVWETQCEYCEELLEDCECDHKRESRADLGWSADDCSDRDNERKKGRLSFDKF